MRISLRAMGLFSVMAVTVIGACGPNDTNVPGTPGGASALPGTGFTPPPTIVSSTSGFNVVAYYSTPNGDIPYFMHEQDLDYITETVAHSAVNASGQITTANPYQTGDMILFSGVKLPTGISPNIYYFAINEGANLIEVASTLANAIAGNPLPAGTTLTTGISDSGSGTFTIGLVAESVPPTSVAAFGGSNEITVNHTYTTGDEISFSSTTQSETILAANVTTGSPGEITTTNDYKTGEEISFDNAGSGLPTGVSTNTYYYAVNIDATHIKLASTLAKAIALTPDITLTQAGAGSFTLFCSGLPVGLYPKTNYYAIEINSTTIEVATSYANALAGTPVAIGDGGSPTVGGVGPWDFNIAHYIYGNLTQTCAIATGTTGEALNCIADGAEEDFWFNGAILQYNVPAGMCDYIVMMPYDYYVMEPGNLGVQTVAVNYNQVTALYTTTSGSPYVSVSSTGTVTLSCPYDYSQFSPAGPNCCEGTYVINVTDDNPPLATNQGAGNIASGEFGGKVTNCLAGPAVDLQPKDQAGFPESTITYGINGLNQTITIAAPMTKSNPYGTQQQSDIYVTDYMDLVKYHGGSFPAGIVPAQAIQANPYYTFTCYDSAFEVINSISLQIRKWDTEANYAANQTGMTAHQYVDFFATSCPISSSLIGALNGTSSCINATDLEPISLGGGYITDHWDWRDYQAYWDIGSGQVRGATNGVFPANAQESSGY